MNKRVKISLQQRSVISLLINLAYALWNVWLGREEQSWWFLTIGAYYITLTLMRSVALTFWKVGRKDSRLLIKFTGIALVATSLPLLGIAIIAYVRDVGSRFHEIIMISIALYSFSKITLAIISLVKAKKHSSCAELSLRHISFADAVVSIASLQRSMLVSFGEMPMSQIRIFNTATSSAAAVLVFLLGILLIRRGRTR